MSASSSKRSLSEDDAYLDAPPAKKRAPAKKKTAASVGLCSLNKKDFGDKIKDCLRLEKYAVQSMMISMQMDVAFFQYDDSSPVIVANLSNEAAGEIFGVSKVKGGNRYSTVHLRSMVVILYPSAQKAQAWVTV
ncbi:hypothetical protein DL96DRAFT_1560416 [Flagelloscypha sp. PMI_526]|nr:hypothetical protein DL96DRAFT_1560416 [Flagelloscypha sp. PMI_526]